MRYFATLFAFAWLPVACGGSQTNPATPGGATAPEGDAASPGDAPAVATAGARFEDMNHRERIDLMKTVVVPKMKPIFQGLDAEHFAQFTCATCHGAGAERGEFDMPNADLPPLPAKGAFQELEQEKPDVIKVMKEQVVPEMASALGMQPFDPSTGEGFGCYDCHTSK
jgi:hypothetical protein